MGHRRYSWGGLDRSSLMIRDILAALVALLLSGAVAAYSSVQPSSQVTWTKFGGGTAWPSAEAACSAGPYGSGASYAGVYVISATEKQCKIQITQGATSYFAAGDSYFASTSVVCPANSVKVGGSCNCAVGFRPTGAPQTCEPYTCLKGAENYPNTSYGPYGSVEAAMADKSVCRGGNSGNGGCRLTMTPTTGKCLDATHCYGSGTEAMNGEYCDKPLPPAPAPVSEDLGTLGDGDTPPPDRCGVGKCPGSINGVSVCVACSTESTQSKDGKTTKPDGSVIDQKQGTICLGDKCTTKTETTGPNGTETVTKTETRDEFCSANPASPLCIQSKISGECASVACSGDAIQCAIAKEQAKRNCEFYPSAGLLTDTGQNAVVGGDRPVGHPGLMPSQTSMENVIDRTDLLGGGGCPSDVSASIMGFAVTMPISQMCPYLSLLGQIGVAISMLAASFIVFKT